MSQPDSAATIRPNRPAPPPPPPLHQPQQIQIQFTQTQPTQTQLPEQVTLLDNGNPKTVDPVPNKKSWTKPKIIYCVLTVVIVLVILVVLGTVFYKVYGSGTCSRGKTGYHEGIHGLAWIDASEENFTEIGCKVQGGHEADGELLYICRTANPNDVDMHLGKLSSKHGVCIALGHKQNLVFFAHYQVLVNPDQIPLHWVADSNGHVPDNAAATGICHHISNFTNYYVGRIVKENVILPGQIWEGAIWYYDQFDVQPKPDNAYYYDANRDYITSNTYEVLVV